MDYAKESLKLHEKVQGKIEVVATVPVKTREDLSLAYTPGVAQPCLEIQKDIEKSYTLTRRHNLCLVVTDGSVVLGLGNIGPEAGMPVMEGKCVLFKTFGGVDAFPLCIKSQDVDTIVETIYQISGSFGGVNLEDISAPRCFEIERKLKEKCDIPIFHDDQHGTAIITLAGLMNALKVVGKKLEDVKIVMSGAGAAAISIAKLLISAGASNVTLCDRSGAIYEGRPEGMNDIKNEMAKMTNRQRRAGTIGDMLVGADVFIGVSAPGTVTTEMVKTMNRDAIIFACANPTPEIFPDDAKAGGAAVIATGRSDFPNQINNVLAFPGVFRGAFDVRASDINDEMKIAAAHALCSLIPDDKLSADYIIPEAFDPRVGPAVAAAVAEADCLCSLAAVAVKNNYCCPAVDESGVIEIHQGRHPVVEAMRPDALFVPNDTYMGRSEDRVSIITGPNMAGKSTYMRQVALMVLMAQIGSFVPAKAARLGIVDRIFTRIGASDDLSAGQSTFMVEMTEVSDILRTATANSLLILDEIGRGTSTFDGMSIARAVLEYCADPKRLGAKTLFATHYHELTAMEGTLPGVKNYNIAVRTRGEEIVFLRKIVPGGADRSYGIEVAKLAGLPEAVVSRARKILRQLEEESGHPAAAPAPREDQVSFAAVAEGEVIDRLRRAQVDSLTPLEALQLLYELKKKLT